MINEHHVVCTEGETGYRKATQIPQFILNDILQMNRRPPCITQPRRVVAIKLAERESTERNKRMGKTVGYCISGERHLLPATPLTSCTTGYMLRVNTMCACGSIINKEKIMYYRLSQIQHKLYLHLMENK